MSKQGDLAIEKALTNIWGKPYDVRYTYNVFHKDRFPLIYPFPQLKDDSYDFNVSQKKILRRITFNEYKAKLLDVVYDICDVSDLVGHPEIRICAYSSDFDLDMYHNHKLCLHNEQVERYIKMKHAVDKINNELHFQPIHKLNFELRLGRAVCSFCTKISSFDNLEYVLEHSFKEAENIYSYMMYIVY